MRNDILFEFIYKECINVVDRKISGDRYEVYIRLLTAERCTIHIIY